MNPVISDEKKLKKVCVARKGEHYYFPKTIPRERQPMQFVYLLILVVIFAVHLYLSPSPSDLLSHYAFIILFYFAVCLTHRLILFIFERKHSVSRYEDKYLRIFKAALYFKVKTYILLVICIIYLVYYGFPQLEDKARLFIIPFLFFLHFVLDLGDFPVNDSLNIAKDNGLDYGSGMAYSFFYGYLNYMLQKIGEPNKNLKEMMEDYESQNKVQFSVYKIFILIPKSLECFESIQNVSRLMTMRSTLPEKQITVGGVKNRVYKNSVYTIMHPTSKNEVPPAYVCTEYATPLKTFKEVVKHSTAHTEFYNRYKNDIVLQFYLTLKQILEHNNMHNMCELVFYEDIDEKGNFYDVGRILLTRIAEIMKGENPKEE